MQRTSRLVLTVTVACMVGTLLASCQAPPPTPPPPTPSIDDDTQALIDVVTQNAVVAVEKNLGDRFAREVNNAAEVVYKNVQGRLADKADKSQIGCRAVAPVHLKDLDNNKRTKDFLNALGSLEGYTIHQSRPPEHDDKTNTLKAEFRLEGRDKDRSGVTKADFDDAVKQINKLAKDRNILLDWVPYFRCYGGIAEVQYVSITGEAEVIEEETVSVDITLVGTRVLPNSMVSIAAPEDKNQILTPSSSSYFKGLRGNSERNGRWDPPVSGGYKFGPNDKWEGTFKKTWKGDDARKVKEWIGEMKKNPDKIYVMIRREVETDIFVRDEDNKKQKDSIKVAVARYLKFEIDDAQGTFRATEIPVENSIEQPACPCGDDAEPVLKVFQKEIKDWVNFHRRAKSRTTNLGLRLSKDVYRACSNTMRCSEEEFAAR